MTARPDAQPYVAARVAAFVKANGRTLVCAECWRGAGTSSSPAPRTADSPRWCARCGRGGATILEAPPAPPVVTRRRRRRRAEAASGEAAPAATCPACGTAVAGDEHMGDLCQPSRTLQAWARRVRGARPPAAA